MYDTDAKNFAKLMAREMCSNEYKGDKDHWLKVPTKALLADVLYHAGKLAVALREDNATKVEEHAADVANLAMMTLLAYQGRTPQEEQVDHDVDSSSCSDDDDDDFSLSYDMS